MTTGNGRQKLFGGPSLAPAGALLCLLLAGCSGYQTFGLPPEPAHARANCQEKQGLTVAAQLLTDPQAVKYHFGPDLRKEGFLPVLVFIENRGENAFEIQRKDFSVVLESGERFDPVSPAEVFSKIRKSTLPAFVLAPLIVPAILLHNDIEQYNFKAALTLNEKSFPQSLRLEKNDPPLARAVFFRDPAGSTRPARSFDSSVLQMKVELEGTRPGDVAGAAVRKDQTAQPVSAADSARTPGGHRPEATQVVGKFATFTVSLIVEDS